MNELTEKIVYPTARLINHFRCLFHKTELSETPGAIDYNTLKDFNKHRPFGPLPKLCYAPWTNLFFNTHGKGIVCCKNTKIVLGSYPKDSIHDMWFSPQRQLLKDSIRNNDLSMGCYKCRESILQKNFSSTTSVFFDKYGMLPLKKYPRVIEFELSNTCNLECIMCSERVSSAIQLNREHKEKMKTPYDDAFVNQLDEFVPYLSEAKFYGGEPFLINVYYDIWEKIISRKPSVSLYVQTNATILNDRIKKILKQGRFMVGISIDSMDKENYERIRKNANFEQTMQNIKWLGSNINPLGLVATPFRQNWKDIPGIVSFCNEQGFHFGTSTLIHPRELALWSLGKNSLQEIVHYYNSVRYETKNNLQRKNVAVFNELKESVKYWLYCKEYDMAFEEHFTEVIHEQEAELGMDFKSIGETQIQQAKQQLTDLLLQNGLSQSGLADIYNIIDACYATVNYTLRKELIYYYLKEKVKPGDIINAYKNMTKKEINNKVTAIFDLLK